MNLNPVTLTGALTSILMTLPACADYHSMEVVVTAYNSVASQTEGNPWLGACGEKLDPAERPIAVSRDLFQTGLDCGTKVSLEGGKKEYVVRDKMGRGKTGRIDLFMGKDVKKAKEFGKQRMRIWWHDDG